MYMYQWHNIAQNYLESYFSSFLLSAVFKCFKTGFYKLTYCRMYAREPKFLFVLEK